MIGFQDPPFKYSSLAPTRNELEFMYGQVLAIPATRVLEFGCGVTTWAIYSALADCGRVAQEDFKYVAIEHFEPCVEAVLNEMPEIHMVTSVWSDIPKMQYDLVFIDSSAGFKAPGQDNGIHRKEALLFAESIMSENAHVIIHDYHRHQPGHRALRKYLDDSGFYKLVASLNDKSGVGVYRKV